MIALPGGSVSGCKIANGVEDDLEPINGGFCRCELFIHKNKLVHPVLQHPIPDSGWTPKVLTYSGFYGLGIKEIWDMIDEYFAFVKNNGYFEFRRNEQSKYWMYESINEHLRDSFYHHPTIETMLAAKEQAVLNGSQTSFAAAKQLLDAYYQLLK